MVLEILCPSAGCRAKQKYTDGEKVDHVGLRGEKFSGTVLNVYALIEDRNVLFLYDLKGEDGQIKEKVFERTLTSASK